MTQSPIAVLESMFGVVLKKVSGTEYAGPCPWCGGEDRFRAWTEGNYWCRPGPGHCGRQGWVDQLDGQERLSLEHKTELRLKRLEDAQRQTEKRLSALERMAYCQDHILYHNALDDDAQAWWRGQGVNSDSIARYRLGYCQCCPTDRERRASYTIPVVNDGELRNIRHRLTTSANGDKYRPHMAGLGTQLFNADFLRGTNEIVVVEGSKKSIVLDQHGFGNVGVMGKRAFRLEWLGWFGGIETVYVALDPDAIASARRLAGIFEGRGRVVNLPVKPDDFFSIYGGSVDEFAGFLSVAKPVRTA